ncbi:MAG TPA: lipid-A-disaccharide synthase [Terriglobales bacterium]|nr:lipid-A-disaccharide synthase [Terriglobales bacterium]
MSWKFLISSGESSGEYYGAGLIEALRRREPAAEFFGVGGSRMREAGCETVVDAHEISVLGLVEVVRHLPHIYSEYRRLLREVDARKPDAAILIDFPDFNLRLARQLHKRSIPVIYYVSPQLWAWRAGRIEQIRKYVRKMLVIFPFEERWYRERGVEAEYAGHPLADSLRPETSAKIGAASSGDHIIALLPGSRHKEVEMHLPTMLGAASLLASTYQFVIPIAKSLDSKWFQGQLEKHCPPGLRSRVSTVDDASSALLRSRAAVVASGTATLETALIGTPFVMVYRVSPLSWTLGRPLVKVDRFAMPNLIAGRDVVPELVQNKFIVKNVVAALQKILPDGPERQRVIDGLAEVRAKLHPPRPGGTASDRAADAVLAALTPK